MALGGNAPHVAVPGAEWTPGQRTGLGILTSTTAVKDARNTIGWGDGMIAIKDVKLQADAQEGTNQYKLIVAHTLVAGNDDVGRSFRVAIQLLAHDQGEGLTGDGLITIGPLTTFFFKVGKPYYIFVPIQAGHYHRTAVQIVPAATLNEDPGFQLVHVPPLGPVIVESRPDEIYAVVRASAAPIGQQGGVQSVEARSPVVTVVV